MRNRGQIVRDGVSSIALGLVLVLGTAQTARAQAAAEPQPAAPQGADNQTADAPISDEIVVMGFRKSYEDALRMKRQAEGVTDSISADSLGRFPDLNVGEALQRVPGVQINREAASRDATINLRGLPGTYVRYTINGQTYADPLLDSSTPLGAFNADVFSAITVIKTPSAVDQAGGLSGIVDLQIAPALGRKDGGFAKLAGEYNTLGKYASPAFTIGYNKHLSDNLAVFGVVAYKKEKFRRDSIFLNAYSPLNPTTTPNFGQYADYYASFAANGSCPSGRVCAAGGTAAKGTQGVRFASDERQVVQYNKGNLLTMAGGAEWRADEHLKLSLNGFYTRRNLSNNQQNLIEVDLRGNRTVISPLDTPKVLADGNAYIQTFNFTNAQVNDSIRSNPLLEQAWDLIGAADWHKDNWHLTGTVVKSRGENNAVQTQIDVRNLPTAAGNGINGSFASGGSNIGGYSLGINRNPAVIVPAGPWSWSPANQPTQIAANGDQLVVTGSSGYGLNQVGAGQFDVEHNFDDLPFLKSIILGGRYERDRYISRGYRTSAKGIQTQNISSSFLGTTSYLGSFFGGSVPGILTNWPQVNYDAAVSALKPVAAAAGDVVTATGWINDPTNAAYTLYNFDVSNDIWAAYGQVKFGFTLAGVSIHGNAGLRYEQTRQIINTQNRQVGAGGAITFVPVEFRQKYHNALPSVIVAADLTDKLVLRGAYYETFVRPQPRNLTPATAVSANSSGYAIAYGGFDLKPYSATAQDLSLEWYNRPGGVFALALYRKRITNLIAPESRLDKLCPADASAFGLGQLTLVGTTCFSNVLVNGQPAIITATGNYNQPNPITVKGLEFSAQQNFDFLPGLLKNLGGQFNYSYTDISGTNTDGSPAVLPGVSKNNINVIGYYETKRFGFRGTYSWRDQYVLTGGSTFTGGASLVAPRSQFDASTSFNFNENFSISLDLYNLTNAKRIQYQVTPDIPRQADYDGRTFTLSLHGTF